MWFFFLTSHDLILVTRQFVPKADVSSPCWAAELLAKRQPLKTSEVYSDDEEEEEEDDDKSSVKSDRSSRSSSYDDDE